MHGDAMDMRMPAQRLLACLGDPSRFRLVVRLSERNRCVSELAVEVGLSQSCTTRHLQALAAVGVVQPSREGKRVVYALRSGDPEIERLIHWVRGAQGPDGPARDASPPSTRPTRQATGIPTARRTALTGPSPAGDGATDPDAIEIERPPRSADLEDFLL
jgi:DNA-binding transcriptional ArsR family regulator